MKIKSKNIYVSITLFLALFKFGISQTVKTVNSALQAGVYTGNYFARDKVDAQPGTKFLPSSRLYLDQTIVVPANYSSSGFSTGPSIINRPLDLNKAVGLTPGEAIVLQNGAGAYNVPITLPPGTNDLIPALSIDYNSMAEDDVMGMGWTIGGLSAIGRNKGTIYNGGIKPVNLTNSDWFSLEGNKLIALTGVNGVDGTVYGTEFETFSKIISHGSIGNGPQWFEVFTKDGKTIQYGFTMNSRLIPDGQNTVLTWFVNKVSDNYGNYIEYNYHNQNGEAWLEEINYTGNQSLNLLPYNTVKFYYESRTDNKSYFFNGGEIKNNVVLRSIEIKADGVLAKKYDFTYKLNVNTYLTEIKETGSDNTQLNSTLIDYGDENPTLSLQHLTNLPSNSSGCPSSCHSTGKYVISDYNFDGLVDLVSFNGDVNLGGGGEFDWFNWLLLKNTGLGNFQTIGSIVNLPFSPNPDDFSTINKRAIGDLAFDYNDINGDGLEDLGFDYLSDMYATPPSPTNPNPPHTGVISNSFPYLSNGSSYTPVSSYQIVINDPSFFSNKVGIYKADFNGDLKIDKFLNTDTKIKIWFDQQSATPSIDQTYNGGDGWDFTKAIPLDIDGDGKADLANVIKTNNNNSPQGQYIVMIQGNSVVFIKDNSSTVYFPDPYFKSLISNAVCPSANPLMMYGDYNGDSKSDYIQCSPTVGNPTWKLFLGKGDGNYKQNSFLNTPSSPFGANCDTYIFPVDINGDGRTDLVQFKRNSLANNTNLTVFYSTGLDFVSESQTLNAILVNLSTYQIDFGDFNGDGILDVFLYDTQNRFPVGAPYIAYMNRGGKGKFVNEIVNGLNVKSEFTFETLVNGTNLYQKTSSEVYPLNTVNGALYVVSKLTIPDGIGGQNTNTYSYSDCIVHKQGKGLIGFKKVTIENNVSNRRTVKEFDFDNTFFVLKPTKTTTSLISPITSLNTDIFTTNFNNIGNQRYFYSITNINSTNFINGVNTKTDFTYDNNGNLTYKKVDISNGLDVNEEFYAYTLAGAWLPSKVVSCTTAVNRQNGGAAYIRSSSFVHDAKGSIIQEIKDPDPLKIKKVQFDYTYDSNTGVMLSEQISAPGQSLPTNIKTYIYDLPKNRFVIKTTNSAGYFTEATYDNKWGKPITEKGIDGLITVNSYDGFGRLTKKLTPNGLISTINYNWVPFGSIGAIDPLPVSDVLYNIETVVPGKTTDKVYCDLFGREKRVETDGFVNKIYKSKIYNSIGKIQKETEGYEIGTTTSYVPVITEYFYDNLFRVFKITTSDGTTPLTTNYGYSYGGGNSTVAMTLPDGKTKTQIMDASGLLISSTDNGGTLTYDYNCTRQTTATKLNGVSIKINDYDEYGNLKMVNEANSNITLYDYNSYGLLNSKTDANNKTYNYQYDMIGRITNMSGPDGLYTYQYITGTNGKSKVEKISGPNNIFYNYTYDNLSRPKTYEENISGQSFVSEVEYDLYSNITKKIYPSGFAINREYTPTGALKKIKRSDNGALIWEAQEYNPLGQLTKYQFGNNATTFKDFDNYGLPKRFNTPGIQDLKYNVNPFNGNLTNRQDGIRNFTENFTYDNLNRLQQWQIAGSPANPPSNTMTYGSNGNILSKTDAGTYTYNGSKINAVDNITNSNLAISTVEQDVQYTSFNKAQNITEGDYRLDLLYGPDQDRKKTDLSYQGNIVSTKYYLPEYEKELAGNNTREVHYINNNEGLCAMYIIENGVGNLYYAHTDHLGSILKVTDQSGNSVAEQSFDAWGQPRNPNDWSYSGTPTLPAWLYRGFTGHEHLPEFSLINMNERIYDPIISMFLSPDPELTDATSTANYNKYNYALNNPLKYKDPTGKYGEEAIIIAIAAILVAECAYESSIENGGSREQAEQNAGVAAILSVAGFMIGEFAAAAVPAIGFLGAAVGGATAGFAVATAQSVINASYRHQQISDVWSNVLVDGLKGALIGGLISGMIGGASTSLEGGDFFTGKGMISASYAQENVKEIKVGEGMEYSTEYAKTFSKNNFDEDQVVGVNELHADGSLPKQTTFKKVGDMVYDGASPVNGATYYNGILKNNSDVYMFKLAFENEQRLYIAMGHEYTHAKLFYNFKGDQLSLKEEHAIIKKWEFDQALKWDYNTNYYWRGYRDLKNYYIKGYEQYTFPIKTTKPKIQ